MAPLEGLLTKEPITITSHPALPMQEAMLLRTIASPEKADYLQQLRWRWTGPFNADVFTRSWAILTERHEVLRSRFKVGPDGRMRMETLSEAEIPIQASRVRRHREADIESVLDEEGRQDRALGMPIDAAPLMRFRLHSLESGQTEILWTSHHALFDGRGRYVLLKEFQEIHRALSQARRPRLEPAPRYSDYLTWINRNDFSGSASFWQQIGKDAEPTPLNSNSPRKSNTGPTTRRRRSLTLDERTTRDLHAWSKIQGVSLNTLAQAAWALTLARTTGRRKVCFGAPRAGRHPPVDRPDAMVGVFVNTVPLNLTVDDDQPKLDWLEAIRATWVAMRPHEQTPLPLIRNAWNWPAQTPLFDSLVGYERYQLSEQLGSPLPGVTWKFQLEATTEIPLTIQVYDGHRIRIEATHDTDLIDEAGIDRLTGRMKTALISLCSDRTQTVGSIDVLPADEKRLIHSWSRRPAPFPADQTIHGLFSEQARRRPHAVALQCESSCLTYAEVEQASTRIARQLIDAGVGIEDRVGLLTGRSIDQVVAMLGILKAGAAYLPLDPEYPDERLEILLNESRTRLVLHDDDRAGRLNGAGIRLFPILQPWENPVPLASQPEITVRQENLAYVLFTSGSTGRPKGVEIPHRAVIRLLFGIDYVKLGPENRLLYLAPASFDASTFEIWGALLHGGCCVVFPDRVPTIQKLAACLRDQAIDTLWLTASLFNFIIDEAPEILQPVRQLLTGGEALSPPHVARAQHFLPDTLLVNGYGPTETTTFACCHRIPPGVEPTAESIPIGRPIGNTCCHILDDRLRPVPIAAVGELFIGGAGVARGYLNQPTMTAERFLSSPFDPADRLYRTGDLVRWRGDGLIDYLGRADQQVKIRGHRIEPGEIEQALCRHPSIRQAVVVVRTHPVRGKELCAWVAAPVPQPPDESGIRAFLTGFLPAYLIPQQIRVIAAIPRNANGKADRKALAQLTEDETLPATAIREKDDPNAPETEAERQICLLISELLGQPVGGATDSFFALGGDSLRASQLIFRLSRTTGTEISLQDLHQCPDPRSLAGLIKGRSACEGTQTFLNRIPRLRKRANVPTTGNQAWYHRFIKENAGRKRSTISRAFRIRGRLDQKALRRAVDLFIARHESMRAVLSEQADGSVILNTRETALVTLERSDLSHLPPGKRLAAAKARFREDALRPFDLARPPGMRVRITRFGPDDAFVTFFFTHTHFDAVSLAVFYREVSAAYGAFAAGRVPDLPECRIQQIDYSTWQRRILTRGKLRQMETFWRATLAATATNTWFPTDGPVIDHENGRDRSIHYRLPPHLDRSVRELSRRSGSTVFMTLLATNAVLIERHTGQSDFLIASVVDARLHPDASQVVGHLGAMVYFRARPGETLRFEAFLAASTRDWMEAVQNRIYPVGRIVKEILIEQGREGQPLTPFFITQGADDPGALQLTDNRVTPVHRHFGGGQSLPKIEIRDTREGISLLISYRAPTFRKAGILRYIRRWEDIIHRLAADPAQPLSDLPTYREPAVPASPAGEKAPTAEAITRIIASVLDHEAVAENASFYHLGGDSLGAMRLLQRLHREADVTVSIDQFNADPTAAGIARCVREGTGRTGSLLYLPAEKPPRVSPKHAWLLRRLTSQGGRSLRFICRIFEVTGEMDHRALTDAINLLCARHDALRMGFQPSREGEVHYQIAAPTRLTIPVTDLSTLPVARRRTEVAERLAEEMREPIDHWQPRPLRVRILRLSKARSILLFSVLHTAVDGRSLQILYRELSAAYAAFRHGHPPILPPSPAQFGAIEHWNEANRKSRTRADKAYWAGQLAAPFPATRFQPEFERRFQAPEPARRFACGLPRCLVERLRLVAGRNGDRLFAALLAGFIGFLARTTGTRDLVIASGIDGRFHPEAIDTIGDFSNNVIIRCAVGPDATFAGLIAETSRQLRTGISHGMLHHSRYPELADLSSGRNGEPSFPVKFSEGPEDAASLNLEGLSLRPVQRNQDKTHLLTDMIVRSFSGRTSLEIAYPTRLYSEPWIRTMTTAYLRFLQRAVQAPDRLLAGMPRWQRPTRGRKPRGRRIVAA